MNLPTHQPLFPALEEIRFVQLGDTGYRLRVWDTQTKAATGQYQLAYAFYEPSKSDPLFTGADYGCSPMHAIDSDESLRGLLGFLTLKPGDTDDEYFASYTADQLDFAETVAEELSMFGFEDSDRIGSPEENPEQVDYYPLVEIA